MRNVYKLCLVIIFVAVFSAATSARADDKAPATQPAGVTGSWAWTQQGPGGDVDMTLKLKQDGDKLTGTISGFNRNDIDIQDGKVQDNQITFSVVRDFNGNKITTTYTLSIDGGELKGKTETVFSRNFDAKREAEH